MPPISKFGYLRAVSSLVWTGDDERANQAGAARAILILKVQKAVKAN